MFGFELNPNSAFGDPFQPAAGGGGGGGGFGAAGNAGPLSVQTDAMMVRAPHKHGL